MVVFGSRQEEGQVKEDRTVHYYPFGEEDSGNFSGDL